MQLGLPSRDYFLNASREIKAYHMYMAELALLFNASSMAYAMEDLSKVIMFETSLANVVCQNTKNNAKIV